MHWAAHGHTAAEVIYDRVSAQAPNLGMTSFSGAVPTRTEARVAKNYLDADELNVLNRMVTAFLEFAELQAVRQKAMTMKEWAGYLDDFLRMSRSNILEDAGRISHKMAMEKADSEYDAYRMRSDSAAKRVDLHFLDAVEASTKMIESDTKRHRRRVKPG